MSEQQTDPVAIPEPQPVEIVTIPGDQAALSVDSVAPPPAIDAAQAGAGTPPVGDTPAADPGEAAPIIESRPLTEPVETSDPIDTPAAALAALGPDSGVAPGTVDIVRPISENVPANLQPADVIDALRTKLAAYGEECLKAVQPEVEYLIRLHPRV